MSAGAATGVRTGTPLLSVRDVRLAFDTFDGVYQAIDGISFDLAPGESLGIVGETGCGKSVTAKAILGLLPSPPARIEGGSILFDGEDLLRAGEARLRQIRGNDIAMIFQDPMTYLNPVFTVGVQLVDVILAHQRVRPPADRLNRAQARDHAVDMLRRVHLPNPGRQLDSYPHQLSGGMRQRVLIAMALSGHPRLLIADEPTTALDVTIQAQILDLIGELRSEFGLSVIMISHDLGVVATVCDRVVVMYAGQVVEDAVVARLFDRPAHPYTRGLLAAVPHPGRPAASLAGIPGTLPNLLDPPAGCRFRARCALAADDCRRRPPPVRLAAGHAASCWRAAEGSHAGA
jgi:oligopeptide/dipeptide ABC transporter ATP-binding protein